METKSGFQLARAQIRALFYRQFALEWSRKCTYITQLLLPLILFGCVLLFSMIPSVDVLPRTPVTEFYNKIDVIERMRNDSIDYGFPHQIAYSVNDGLDDIVGYLPPSGNNVSGLFKSFPRYLRYSRQYHTEFYIPYAIKFANETAHLEHLANLIRQNKLIGSPIIKNIWGGIYFDKVDLKTPKFEYILSSNDETRFCGGLFQDEERPPWSPWMQSISKFIEYLNNPNMVIEERTVNYTTPCEIAIRSSAMTALHNAFIEAATNGKVGVRATVQTMPYKNPGTILILDQLSNLYKTGLLIIPLLLIFPLPVLMYSIVLEKSHKIREMMRLNGLKMRYYWLVYFLWTYGFYSFIATIVIIFSLVLKFNYIWGVKNFFISLIIFAIWGFTLIAFSIFLSSLFKSTLVATVIGYIIALGAPIFGLAATWQLIPRLGNWGILALFIPPLPFHQALEMGVIIPCENLEYPRIVDIFLGGPLSQGIVFMILDAIIYTLLGFYLDAVLPKEWGVRREPWFFLKPIFNLCRRKKNVQRQIFDDKPLLNRPNDSNNFTEGDFLEDSDVRAEREKIERGDIENAAIIINHLSKNFGSKEALSNLCISANKGEVFALLGPNGAGKTTAISIISGLFAPTSGTAIVNGFDILSDLDGVRQSMGLCPQHDIVWDALTVKQHLLFYCRLKGVPSNRENEIVDDILNRVGLANLGSNAKAGNLSGGMKRRLSIGIALVGSPTIVLLDEPTSGLDPTTRRQIWDIISNEKLNKCIILTTHSLEEADVLSNRIGILSRGKLQCLGSPFHLKSKFGQGYRLSITYKEDDEEEAHRYINSIIQDAKIMYKFAGITIFNVPKSSVKVSWLFNEIETNKSKNKIIDWAFSQTTLEDVFMRIVRDGEK